MSASITSAFLGASPPRADAIARAEWNVSAKLFPGMHSTAIFSPARRSRIGLFCALATAMTRSGARATIVSTFGSRKPPTFGSASTAAGKSA